MSVHIHVDGSNLTIIMRDKSKAIEDYTSKLHNLRDNQ